MYKKIFTSFVLTASFAVGIAQTKLIEKITAKKGEIIIPYEKYELANGLTVVLAEDHSDPLVHVDVTYHVGSAREEIGKSGFAHFFEHMMFQGSDNVADEQHFKIVSGAGGTLNGSTNQDRTNYYQTVPANQLEKMLWLEADRMGFLLDAVTQKKFEIQRSTVKNERGQNYDNRPYGLVREFTAKNLYPYGHPYSWLTIGYIEDLNRVDVNDLKNFFLRWYGPNNATITIGGDLKVAETLKLIEKYFGSIPRGPEVTKTILPAVVLNKDRYVSLTDNYAKLPQLSKVFPTVPNYSKDMAAIACLAQVLGQGKNSILYQELVKTQKVLNASCFSSFSELAGELSFSVTPFAGKSLSNADSLLKQAFVTFEKRGVTDDDVEKFKGAIESQFINGLQSVSGKVSQLAAFQTFTGNPNRIGIQLEMYRAVTKEAVLEAYNKYVKNKYSTTVSVLVKQGNVGAAMADNYKIDSSIYDRPNYGYTGLTYTKAKDNFDRSKQPIPGVNPLVKAPAFTKKTSKNGIKMIFANNDEIPVVNITIKIPGGRLAETNMPNKYGVADMMATMMNEGTKKLSAEQMALELQKIGSSVNVFSDFDGLICTVQSLKKNLNKTLALVEERLLNPVFSQDDFTRIQKRALEGLKQKKSQPVAIADEVFDKLNFGTNNILGNSSDGTVATITNLTLADVQDFYNKNLTATGASVVVVGDVSEAEILPQLSFLDKLPKTAKANIAKPAKGLPITKTKIYLVDVPKAAQTEFRVGTPTNKLYDATGEYYKLGLLNYTLGGDFNSRLNINLREDKGWTYGARSGFSSDDYGGTFAFSSGIRANATDSALVEVIKEIKNYAANGVTDEELAFMKKAIGQRDARAYETGGQKASFVSRILEYNLPANFTTTQSNILKNMSKAELNALAKKWLDVNKMNILLVGDKANILPGLQKLGYEIVELDADGNKK
jgi:zinc protease